MSLESKSKTLKQLQYKYETCDIFNEEKIVSFDQKWVPLEDAQQELSEWTKEFERNNAFSYQTIEKLSAKIEAYRKWLNTVQKSEYEGLRRSRFLEKFTEIFHVVEIPRKEADKL